MNSQSVYSKRSYYVKKNLFVFTLYCKHTFVTDLHKNAKVITTIVSNSPYKGNIIQ